NAHPHFSQDQRFYLVHNGVITNFAELKQKYLTGVEFKSDTDTEVAVQLIDYFALTEHLNAQQALQKTVQLLEGSYAFALMDRQEPDKIFIAKNKSPLLIGLADGYNVVCSDAIAMLDQTHTFMEIHDGELGVITNKSVELTDHNGQPVSRQPYQVQMDANDVSKGTYDNYMLKEIDEQPVVLRRIASQYCQSSQSKLSES
ncbi:glutamine--fructose-6-phosphate aminotransferase, partial [Lactobacillus sp. XV13L]|nr:glutamine--fructose-6-phosphate aminotransferase [Lactobacillus sp. XV13L]